jgi:DNA replication licensing factor MCM2
MYARERVRPKLYDLDSEKLSRLFADLRRESVATGSFPITVRHLESMIRMAEASARMSLREYVRADDIDLAISVAVESFVNAQKMSIKKTLQRVRAPLFSSFFTLRLRPCVFGWGGTFANGVFRTTPQGFRKYLTQSRDHEELLAFLLGQIVKEKARFFQLQRHQQPELVTVTTSELDERVRDRVAADTLCMQALTMSFFPCPRPKSTRSTTPHRSCSLVCSPRMATRLTVTSSRSILSSRRSQHCTG